MESAEKQLSDLALLRIEVLGPDADGQMRLIVTNTERGSAAFMVDAKGVRGEVLQKLQDDLQKLKVCNHVQEDSVELTRLPQPKFSIFTSDRTTDAVVQLEGSRGAIFQFKVSPDNVARKALDEIQKDLLDYHEQQLNQPIN